LVPWRKTAQSAQTNKPSFGNASAHRQRLTSTGNVHHVPKDFLASDLEARMHSRELKIAAELTESPTLKEELRGSP